MYEEVADVLDMPVVAAILCFVVELWAATMHLVVVVAIAEWYVDMSFIAVAVAGAGAAVLAFVAPVDLHIFLAVVSVCTVVGTTALHAGSDVDLA